MNEEVNPMKNYADLLPYIMLDYEADIRRQSATKDGKALESADWQIFQDRLHQLLMELKIVA